MSFALGFAVLSKRCRLSRARRSMGPARRRAAAHHRRQWVERRGRHPHRRPGTGARGVRRAARRATPDGACGSRSFSRNSSPGTPPSRFSSPRGGRASERARTRLWFVRDPWVESEPRARGAGTRLPVLGRSEKIAFSVGVACFKGFTGCAAGDPAVGAMRPADSDAAGCTSGAMRTARQALKEGRAAGSCSPRLRFCWPDAAVQRRRRNTARRSVCVERQGRRRRLAAAASGKSTARSAAITARPCRTTGLRGQRGAVAPARRTAADRPAGDGRPRRAGNAGGDGARSARRMRSRPVEDVRGRRREPRGAGLRHRLHPDDGDGRAATPTPISFATRSWRCRREKP